MCVTNSLELIVIKISLRYVSKLPRHLRVCRVKKEMEEKALAAHEEEQAARSFNSVEGLVAGAGAAMGADEFSQMKKSSSNPVCSTIRGIQLLLTT